MPTPTLKAFPAFLQSILLILPLSEIVITAETHPLIYQPISTPIVILLVFQTTSVSRMVMKASVMEDTFRTQSMQSTTCTSHLHNSLTMMPAEIHRLQSEMIMGIDYLPMPRLYSAFERKVPTISLLMVLPQLQIATIKIHTPTTPSHLSQTCHHTNLTTKPRTKWKNDCAT